MDEFRREEFAALRATIRERGTVRTITFLVTMIAWAALALTFLIAGAGNIVGLLLSLMVLVAGFEAILQMHIGVERVGRYLQVAFEENVGVGPRWETTAMEYGRAYASAGSDALFRMVFLIAIVVNLLPVLRATLAPVPLAIALIAHVAFLVRMRIAATRAARQRAEDLERFRALLGGQARR